MQLMINPFPKRIKIDSVCKNIPGRYLPVKVVIYDNLLSRF